MQTRPKTIIAAGAATALIGALLVFAYGRSVSSSAEGAPAAQALVATEEIPAGTPWEETSGKVDERPVPEDARPVSAVDDPETLDGRRSVRAVQKGEVITTAQFGLREAAPADGLDIPPGQNAVSVDLGAPQGVAGYVQPGDFVNVYATFEGPADGDGETVTKLTLSNVQVLANRTADSEGDRGSGSVFLTLALTPHDAEKVVHAKQQGRLWLGLVHPGDPEAETPGVTRANVLG